MSDKTVGMIGLGAMGLPMALNFISAGYSVVAYDLSAQAVARVVAKGAIEAGTPAEVAAKASIVVTMVPNDAILTSVVCNAETGIIKTLKPGGLHISCSTISPDASRVIAQKHAEHGSCFIGAPIFARADGVAAKQASFVVGGDADSVARAMPLLRCTSDKQFVLGADPGAGNVAKLAGNFLIAASIECMAEALTFGEKNGVDRAQLMEMLNTTIFDCLIYKGYGNRVAARSHVPGDTLVGPGFQLDLGLKDVTLITESALKSQCPMPVASLLRDRFLASVARGRGKMDWSAISLAVSEDAGVDVSASLPKP